MKHKLRFFNMIILILACVTTCLFQVAKVKADNSIPSDYGQIVYNQDNGLGSSAKIKNYRNAPLNGIYADVVYEALQKKGGIITDFMFEPQGAISWSVH